MPYTMDIYPDETEKYPIPKEGDLFIVTRIVPDVLDLHWGRCVGVELERIDGAIRENFKEELTVATGNENDWTWQEYKGVK